MEYEMTLEDRVSMVRGVYDENFVKYLVTNYIVTGVKPPTSNILEMMQKLNIVDGRTKSIHTNFSIVSYYTNKGTTNLIHKPALQVILYNASADVKYKFYYPLEQEERNTNATTERTVTRNPTATRNFTAWTADPTNR